MKPHLELIDEARGPIKVNGLLLHPAWGPEDEVVVNIPKTIAKTRRKGSK